MGCVLLNPSLAKAQLDVSSDAIGYYRFTMQPGFQTVSISMIHAPAFTSTIASSTTTTVTSSFANAQFDNSVLADSTEYYIEITSGPNGLDDPHVGQRFEVDEDTTRAAASNVLTVESSTYNTSATVPDLTDYTFEIRPHLTLNEVFDNSLFQGSFIVTQSDQLLVFNGTNYDTYYIWTLGNREWRRFGQTTNEDNRPLYPGEGILFRRLGATPVPLMVKGRVRANPFVQPLQQGFNLAAEGYPKSTSPSDRDAVPGNFTGFIVIQLADQVSILNASGFYDTYYLQTIGQTNSWRRFGDAVTNYNDLDIFDYRKAVFINRKTADPAYRVPLPWTP